METGAAPPTRMQVSLKHRLQYALFRLTEEVLRILPAAACHCLGGCLGRLVGALSPKHRRIVTRNLRLATGMRGDDPELARLVRRTFFLNGANLVSATRTSVVPWEKIRDRFTVEGGEEVGAALTAGRPVVMILGHMANWEGMAHASRLFLPPGTGAFGFYRRLNNPLLDRLLLERRQRSGMVFFDRDENIHKVFAYLRTGKLVSMFSDQNAGHKGVIAPYFGKLTSCTGLPELLARRTRAACFAGSMTTTGPARWLIRFRTLDGNDTLTFMHAIETSLRHSLCDGFWLHNRWRVFRPAPTRFNIPKPVFLGLDQVTRPARLLVSCRGIRSGVAAAVAVLLETRADLEIVVADTGDLPPLPDTPRLRRVPFDRDTPPEQLAGQVARLDASEPTPFDGAILFDGDTNLATACRKAGLPAVVGITEHPAGNPWHATRRPGHDDDSWRALGEVLAREPSPANKP